MAAITISSDFGAQKNKSLTLFLLLSSLPAPLLASGQISGREHSPTHQQKMGLKIYWAWPRPLDPDSPSVSLSHQEASISLLSFSIRGQTDWKPQSQKTTQIWSHGPEPHLTQWNYKPCHVGPPKTDRSWWRVLTKHGPLEKGMANHLSILAWEPHEQYEKAKR